ncbi:VOC family protein [Cryptosporangium aurantiacum]|uniref:Glyoxalase/Bleomycin resistance protein/Dioxygenase superfamily protein n=1 Tax=Cryptosporangium aurantiacum TaxID=134849 RepID=A0A1M7KNQ4_9ACTN|nr:VOC family protein [Cryptosporangium aurantiacum]SHM67132.1 Glyoxalase/Bleomycin resistance protein/Dioxygenase superfamily protein [Cryptosporangium aurantiacum]
MHRPKKTGDYGIGQMIHCIHMTDDVKKLNDFYRDVFGALLYMGEDEPNYLPPEDRWASLMMVGDLCIETMAPNTPVDATKPVGKFYTKFGRHWHSVGYRVDDLTGLANNMIERGIYIGRPGGGKVEKMDEGVGYFYPSPRDMFGLMAEMCTHDMPNDPRLKDGWAEQERQWEQHPLTIRRLAHVMLGVKDLDAATASYVNRVQAVPLQSGVDDVTQAKFQIVQLGDSLLKLVQPLDDASDLGRHVAKYGNMIYAVTFRVTDLDSAERWLTKKNIRTTRPTPTTVAADPADTWGAPYFFTTESIPDDPFED